MGTQLINSARWKQLFQFNFQIPSFHMDRRPRTDFYLFSQMIMFNFNEKNVYNFIQYPNLWSQLHFGDCTFPDIIEVQIFTLIYYNYNSIFLILIDDCWLTCDYNSFIITLCRSWRISTRVFLNWIRIISNHLVKPPNTTYKGR